MRLGAQPYLSSPVTKVVERDDLPAARAVQVGEECADDGTSEVADVEGLGDVWGRVLDDKSLALPEVV